jgi:hypothetical protein
MQGEATWDGGGVGTWMEFESVKLGHTLAHFLCFGMPRSQIAVTICCDYQYGRITISPYAITRL